MRDAAVHRVVQGLAALLLGVASVGVSLPAHARGPVQGLSLQEVPLAELPAQGRTTYALILRGGPFPYDKDGTVFGNRERLLPAAKRGHYREYTVKTPWSRDRGARRIVCGGTPPTQPQVCYYTGDHYNSFRKITP